MTLDRELTTGRDASLPGGDGGQEVSSGDALSADGRELARMFAALKARIEAAPGYEDVSRALAGAAPSNADVTVPSVVITDAGTGG